MNEVLLGSKVSFRRLNGRMTQHLDLFKFASSCATQLGASAAEVVRRDAGNSGRHGGPASYGG
jgi:hypothetical protein